MSVEWDEDGGVVDGNGIILRDDGDFVRVHIHTPFNGRSCTFTPAGARAIAARLLALADEIDPQ